MSALGFLGGLGQFATGFQQGFEKSEDREQVMKDREQLMKDREYQRQQREFEQGQQQRKLDEQKRADDLRTKDAAVSTTEDVTMPGSKTIYGADAPVVQDDEGNLMPGAQVTPDKTVTRQRNMDSVYRDYAENRKAQGDTEGYFKYHDLANKQATIRTSNAFLQVQAEAAGKTPVQLAQEIGKIFDSDPMNSGTKSIEPIEGGVRMTLINKDTGLTSTKEFVGPDANKQLIAAFSPYFRPESYAKLLEKKADIAAEIEKDPYKQVPGGYIDKRTGKFNATMVGQDIIGTNQDGTPIYGSRGTGSGSGSGAGSSGGGSKEKAVDPLKATTDAVEFAIDKSAAKGSLEPSVVARANTMGRQLAASALAEGRGLDPAVAAELAINAATGKIPVSPSFNPRTGTIDNVVEYQGNKFSVEGLGKPGNARLDDKQLSSIATNYIATLPAEQRTLMVAAAYNKEARAKLDDSLAQRARAPEALAALEQRLGRKPTEEDIAAVTKSMQAALTPSLELISRYATLSDEGKKVTKALASEAGYATDFSGPAKKKAEPPKTSVSGMDPKKYSGMSGNDLSRAVAADSQKLVDANRGNAERLQAARKSAAEDPEILALETKRSNQLRAGKAYEANDTIAQINKIRKERYGL
jgi:hypothetical protein